MRRLEQVSTLISCASQLSKNLLDVEDGVLRVHSSLVLGRLTDQTLLAGEGHERGSGEATLLVGDCGQTLLDIDLLAMELAGAY